MVTITITDETFAGALSQFYAGVAKNVHVNINGRPLAGDFQLPELPSMDTKEPQAPPEKEQKRDKKTKEAITETKGPETPAPPTGSIAYSVVQEIIPRVLKVVKREELITLFGQFDGAKSARDLKPEQYQEFIALAQKMIDAAPKVV